MFSFHPAPLLTESKEGRGLSSRLLQTLPPTAGSEESRGKRPYPPSPALELLRDPNPWCSALCEQEESHEFCFTHVLFMFCSPAQCTKDETFSRM